MPDSFAGSSSVALGFGTGGDITNKGDAFLFVAGQGYRQRWRSEHRRVRHVLHWRRPGTVWATDFAESPCRTDGLYPYVLAVRDLASGQQLLWQPVLALTAQVVLAELPWLFALHGAPGC